MTRVWMPPPFPWMIFAVLVLSPLTGCIETETPERTVIRPVRTVTVDDVDGFKKRGFPGLARAAQEVDLAFRVDGPLIARPVNVGDQVEQGQLVARIDPRDFQISLTSVEAELTQVRSDLALAEAEYGVPAQYIVAILGVETRYGRITGNDGVLEALATLAFGYPRRSKFFTSELENYLLLTRDGQVVLSDRRYTTQLESECPNIDLEIRGPETTMLDCVARVLRKAKVR